MAGARARRKRWAAVRSSKAGRVEVAAWAAIVRRGERGEARRDAAAAARFAGEWQAAGAARFAGEGARCSSGRGARFGERIGGAFQRLSVSPQL